MATLSEQGDVIDYFYLEGLFLEEPLEKYSCPICLSPVQREAYLTQCCGKHFCHQCIRKMVDTAKPCPMCKAHPMIVFPNKERQREINSIQVYCPVQVLQAETRSRQGTDRAPLGHSLECDWTGELGNVDKHLKSSHPEDRRWKFCCTVHQPLRPSGEATPTVGVAVHSAGTTHHTEYLGKSAPDFRDLYFVRSRQEGRRAYELFPKLLSNSEIWRVIGQNLGLENGLLECFDYEERHVKDKLRRVFSKWQDNACNLPHSDRYPHSWEGLRNMLVDAQKADVAEEYFAFLESLQGD